ncbi:tryptophan synthase subunit alpha [Candidatus Bathyarchaeota archaeon]|nr:tryptophan synthase subunit alpha [Candidatus Bathyarchaeota archaeon]
MRKIERKFMELENRNERALIGYVTCGDPTADYTPRIADALINGGVDMLELGIPFSDPIADGPIIQRATLRALRSGMKPREALKLAGRIAERHEVPIIILTYYNIVYRMGLEKFFKLARENEVSGTVIPDLPVEEASEYKVIADKYDVDTIFLAAPSTSNERLRRIMKYSSGFLYLVSVFGVTGVREKLREESIKFIKRASSIAEGKIRLAVGFGISKPEHVRNAISAGVDGVIVGSRFVKVIEENLNNENRMLIELRKTARKLKDATKT